MFDNGKRKLDIEDDVDMTMEYGPIPKATRLEPISNASTNIHSICSSPLEALSPLSLLEANSSCQGSELDLEDRIWGSFPNPDSSPPSEDFAFLASGYQRSSSTAASRTLLQHYPSMAWLAKITPIERQIRSQINRNSRPVSMVFYKSDYFATEELEAIEILYSVKDRFTMVMTPSYKEREICIRRLLQRGLFNGHPDLRVHRFNPDDCRRLMFDMMVMKRVEDPSASSRLSLASENFDMEMDVALIFPESSIQVAEHQSRRESIRAEDAEDLAQSLGNMCLDQEGDIEM